MTAIQNAVRRCHIDFAVICLPRSGSAWVSNFLSYGNLTFCHHELVSRETIGMPTDLEPLAGLVGNADGIYAFDPEWPETDIPFCFVRRHPRAVIASLRAAKITDEAILPMIEAMDRLHAKRLHKAVVEYGDLFSADDGAAERAARTLWDNLIPLPFDPGHWKRCRLLRVTTTNIPS